MSERLVEVFKGENIEFVEASEARKKKEGVLGTIKGTFFCPNEISRNKRVYHSKAWETALGTDDVKRFLDDRLMFGTVGHADMDFDEMLREKKVSHVVTKLSVNPNNPNEGYGEADILDTELGRLMAPLYKSGSKFSVSSKATGAYDGQDKDGNDIIDSKTFRLERFDLVVDPGFLQAQPKLKEALESICNCKTGGGCKDHSVCYRGVKENLDKENNKEQEEEHTNTNTNTNKEEVKMSENNLAEKLMEEKVKMENDLAEAVDKIKVLETENATVGEKDTEIVELKKQLEELTVKADALAEFIEKNGELEKIAETLKTADEIFKTVLEMADEKEDVVKAIGETKTVLEDTNKFLKDWKDRDLGTVEKVHEALKIADAVADRLITHGGIDNIEEALKDAYNYIENNNKEKSSVKAEELSAELGIDKEKIENCFAKGMTEEEVKDLFKDVAENAELHKRFTKDEDDNKDNKKKGKGEGKGIKPPHEMTLSEKMKKRIG